MTGADGMSGSIGGTGAMGLTGPQGMTGVQGLQGTTGNKGLTGVPYGLAGTTGQTLYYDGNNWTPSSLITNDGSDVSVGQMTSGVDINASLLYMDAMNEVRIEAMNKVRIDEMDMEVMQLDFNHNQVV